MKLATAKQMQTMDNTAINERNIPSTHLMENAAGHVARAALDLMKKDGAAAIFCGSGNNGGDGVAAAVYLRKRQRTVRVFLVSGRERLSPDLREMERRLVEIGGELETFNPQSEEILTYCQNAAVIIDAIFGTGLNTDLRGKPLAAVQIINRMNVPVISADIPSGIEADTGRELRASIKAAKTITFSLPKAGLFVGRGGGSAGQVEVADIGIPQDLVQGLETQCYVTARDNISLPPRDHNIHKGDCGKLLIIGGSVGYTGAVSLAAQAALRGGAGLVSVGVPEPIYAITAIKQTEAMPFPLPAEQGKISMTAFPALLERLSEVDACLIGPGLGRSPELTTLVTELILASKVPVILDADGINAISGNIHVLDEAKAPLILTPHDMEFKRLGGDVDSGDRLESARAFALAHHCTLVRKGPGTISAFPEGTVCVNTTGNPGMATGGSGDVLAGLLTAFVGQKLSLAKAVYTAVWAHGRAGDLCAERLGEYAMLPGDLLDTLPEVLKSIVR